MKRFVPLAVVFLLANGPEASAWSRKEFSFGIHYSKEKADNSFFKGLYHDGPGPYASPPPPVFVQEVHPAVVVPADPKVHHHYHAPAVVAPHDSHHQHPQVPALPAPPVLPAPSPGPAPTMMNAMYWVPAGR